jgi:hypothetical protein
MIKRTYKYKDYNDNEREETYYFDLRDDELVKLELGTRGGLSEKIKRLISTQDIPEIIKVFEDVVKMSYGEKSADGREFIKDPALTKSFMQTKGYSMLFMDFITKENFASDFFNELVPNTAGLQTVEEEKTSESK